jgi:hypothetical protein
MLRQALELKELGNSAFKGGELERAVRRYTASKAALDSDYDLEEEAKATAKGMKARACPNSLCTW